MAVPRKHDRTGELVEDGDTTPPSRSGPKCQECLLADPQERTRHHFRLLRDSNLDGFRDHVFAQYVTLRDVGKKRQDTVDTLVTWAANLIQQYSGMADPQTGRNLRWWEARQWLMDHRDATAASSFQQAGEKWKQHIQAHEVPGFTRPSLAQRLGAAEFARQATAHMPTDTPEAARAKEIKQTHLAHKQLLGSRYRPPCIHGHRGDDNDKHWPDNPCDPDLCSAVSLTFTHVRMEPGDDDPLAI